VVGEGVLGDGNLQEIVLLGEVGGLEVEGDGDERLDALDRRGLSPKRGVVVCSGGRGRGKGELSGCGHGRGRAARWGGYPRAAAVEEGGGGVRSFV
jgi:hypothetical protein